MIIRSNVHDIQLLTSRQSIIMKLSARVLKLFKLMFAILAAVLVCHIITRKLAMNEATVFIQDSGGCESGTDLLEEWRNSIVTSEDLNLYPDLGRRHGYKKINKCLFINQSKRGLEKVMNDQNFKGVHCALKKASFSDTSDHHTALASFPGSGNTWTRHLMEYISGIHTGSVYNDKQLKMEFGGEGHTERVIAIKTHKKDKINYDNAVILIRSPREAILSWYNFKTTKSHTAKTKEALFKTTAWPRFVATRTNMWKEFYLRWLTSYKGRMMVLSYSRLRKDFFNELYRLGDFLNISMSYQSLWCVFEKREGSYHRHSNIDMDEVFNKDMLDKMARARDEVEAELSRLFGEDARTLF